MTRTTVGWMALAVAGMLAVNAPLLGPRNLTRNLPEKLRGDPDAMDERGGERARERDRAPDNSVARPGPDLGPAAYADEQYALRAYPASEIPFSATVAAQQAFGAIAARGAGRAGTWSLYGPSTSVVPSTLSFYGGGPLARYITSGRITSLAIAPTCTAGSCVVLLGAAGGGIWRTDRALAGNPVWRYVSEEIPSNAIGAIERDPNDPTGKTYYAGTGEAHASGDSAAGIGLFRSVDGGETWAAVGTSASVSYGRAIGTIAIDPTNASVLYIGTARAVRGISSVTGGATSIPPVAAPLGVYRSLDGGATWASIWDGNASLRGINHVEVDPLTPTTIYAAAYQQGIWRSTNNGASFERIFQTLSYLLNTARSEFDVTVKSGATRMYVGDGAQGDFGQDGARASGVFRADAVNTTPAAALVAGNSNIGWTALTSSDPADPGYGSYDYCTGQCWYDNYIITPQGHPDVVYLGGSHQYGETYGLSNGRGLVLSTDGGATFTDMTVEGATPLSAINLHPDHHWIVVHPADPFTFFSATDGGIVRSNGQFVDVSAQCAPRGLEDEELAGCQRLLSRVPERLTSLNAGLATLQFQSILSDPANYRNLVGGTQDNGTWVNSGSSPQWDQTIYGDGGQAGFSRANSQWLFNNFTGSSIDANFRRGAANKWVVISGPIYQSGEGSLFYPPQIADPNPAAGGTIFKGTVSVWRTQNWGGDQAYLEANCPEFTTFANDPDCGDFVRLGAPGATSLTAAGLGDRAGGAVGAIERGRGDTSTLWVATTTGRVFISKNADAPAASVTFTRLDSLAANDPGRFVSSIYVDPADGNHAWISYSGYNFNTQAQPGHVFEVRYTPGVGVTWTNLDGGTGPIGDLPVTDLVRDDATGDLYAATDFGVARLPAGTSTWLNAGAGLPVVVVSGLEIAPGERALYAATHGRSIWRMVLP